MDANKFAFHDLFLYVVVHKHCKFFYQDMSEPRPFISVVTPSLV